LPLLLENSKDRPSLLETDSLDDSVFDNGSLGDLNGSLGDFNGSLRELEVDSVKGSKEATSDRRESRGSGAYSSGALTMARSVGKDEADRLSRLVKAQQDEIERALTDLKADRPFGEGRTTVSIECLCVRFLPCFKSGNQRE
jgi:hypothetical protein